MSVTKTKSWRKFVRKATWWKSDREKVREALLNPQREKVSPETRSRHDRIFDRLVTMANLDKLVERFPRLGQWIGSLRPSCMIAGGSASTTLTGTMNTAFSWNFQYSTGVGSSYNPTQNQSSILLKQSLGTQAANNASGGCDEVFSFQQGIVAGGTATLDLNAMTDLLNRSAVTIVRIKGYQFRVLSATNDPTITPAPTATSVGLVTNFGVTLPAQMDFSSGGSGLTLAITQTAGALDGVTIGAAGSGYLPSATFVVAPVQASGSGGLISVTTNSTGVPTSVALVSNGANYTNNTVPSVSVGHYTVYTGGAHLYVDPSANGFTTISATQKNLLLVNLDGAHAITFEIDVFGATT